MNPKCKQNIYREVESFNYELELPTKKLSVCHIDEKTLQELIDKGNAGNEMAVVFLAEWLHEMNRYEERYNQFFNHLKMYFA